MTAAKLILGLAAAMRLGAQTPDCAAQVAGLTNPSADTRDRTARALYRSCPPEATAALAALPAALRKSIEMGNANAAAFLLLGRFPDAASRGFLEKRVGAKAPMLKLDSWQKPVAAGLAAAVAASSASEAARTRVKAGLGPVDEAAFLVAALPAISDPSTLRTLAALLADERTVSLGVPSGASPRLRIADLAVEAFRARWPSNGFTLRPGDRYTAAEIGQVKQMVLSKTN